MRHTYIEELVTYYSKKGKEEIRDYYSSRVSNETVETWNTIRERKIHILKQECARVD